MVISMLKELRDNFNNMRKDIKTMKKNQSEIKNTVYIMRTTLEGINRSLDEYRIKLVIWKTR